MLPAEDIVEHRSNKDCVCQPKAHFVCMECDGDGCSMCDHGLVISEGNYVDDQDEVIWVHYTALANTKVWPVIGQKGKATARELLG